MCGRACVRMCMCVYVCARARVSVSVALLVTSYRRPKSRAVLMKTHLQGTTCACVRAV